MIVVIARGNFHTFLLRRGIGGRPFGRGKMNQIPQISSFLGFWVRISVVRNIIFSQMPQLSHFSQRTWENLANFAWVALRKR